MCSNRDLLRQIAGEFEVGDFTDFALLEEGNAETFQLFTSRGQYFVKPAPDAEVIALYKTVEERLNANGVRQARLYSKPDGEFISSSGCAVFEFLHGQVPRSFSDKRLKSLILYLAKYNEALSHIPIPSFVTNCGNPWKKADSLAYLLAHVSGDIAAIGLDEYIKDTAEEILNFLATSRADLERAPHQLLHGDVGPGNVIYNGEDVVSIVDFTPHCGPELYALCHLFYWHFLFPNDGTLDCDDIEKTLRLYIDSRQIRDFSPTLFHALFVKATAFRLFGPLISLAESPHTYSKEALARRAHLARSVLRNQAIPTIL